MRMKYANDLQTKLFCKLLGLKSLLWVKPVAMAAFVGFAEKGPVNTHTLVTNWSQFVETFGDFMEGSYLAHAVYGYYNNGGGRCYIVRIGATDGDGEGAGAWAVGPFAFRLMSASFISQSRLIVV